MPKDNNPKSHVNEKPSERHGRATGGQTEQQNATILLYMSPPGVPGTNKHTIHHLMRKKQPVKPVTLQVRVRMKRIHQRGAKNKATSRNEP